MKKFAKIILRILLFIIALFLLIVLAIQIPFVQKFLTTKTATFLEDKIETKVKIGSIEIGLPKKVILHDFYFEDQSKDTLLAGKTLKVDVSLFQLLNNKLEINSIKLEEVTANIEVNNDSVFNFDYIIKAFETPNAPKEVEDPMEISINSINLDAIKFRYKNAIDKNSVTVKIHHFDTEIKKFDLNNLTFSIPEINLKGLKLHFNQDAVKATQKIVEKVEKDAFDKILKLSLKHIKFEEIDVIYKDANTKTFANIAFEKLNTKVKTLDLEKQIVVLSSIELAKTNGEFTLGKIESVLKETTKNPSALPWQIDVNTINIDDFNFVFDNNKAIKTQQGIDYNHLKINDLTFKGNSIAIGSNACSGIIDSFNFYEQSGFKLEALTTNFNYTNKGVFLKNINIQTPQTTLHNNISVTYPSIKSISENPEKVILDVDLRDSKIGFKDVLLLVPQLNSNEIFKKNANATVNFNASITGKLDNLKINRFNAHGLKKTKLDLKGTITGLPKIDESVFDINILNFESSSKAIHAFSPKNAIPNSIQLPEKFNLKGDFKGSVSSFDTNLILKSNLGNANISALLNRSKINNEKYKADITVENLDLGTLLKNNQFGKVTANAKVDGTSLDPEMAYANLTSKIVKAQFNNYVYQNIEIDGSIENGLFKANANANDENLTFVLDAKGASNLDKPNLDLNLNLDIIDLKQLNFFEEPLKMRGYFMANFEDLNPQNLNGTLYANNFLVALENEQFPLDTISIKAVSTIEKDSIILKSQFVNGLVEGNFNLSTIVSQLSNSISKYYQFDKEYVKPADNQNLDFKFTIKDNTITKKILPEIKELSEISLSGSYHSINDSILINASIPKLNYANNTLSNGVLKVNTNANALNYNLSFGTIKNEQFEIPQTVLAGELKDNIINYQLNVKDVKNKDKYFISGSLKDSLNASVIHFNPEKLLLNYDEWKIDESNLITSAENGLLVSNLVIENKKQLFSVQSESNVTNAPITVNFNNFKLESLTSIAKSNFEVGGTINGETTIKNISEDPVFVSDLNIKNLRIKKDTVGDLVLKVNNKTENLYKVNMDLTGLSNQLNIVGNYNISSENLDFIADIKRLQMKSIQPFTLNNLNKSEGYLNGEIDVKGKAASPKVNGSIKFNSVGFHVVPLNSRFNLINDKIVFKTNKIVFKDFKLHDENDNPLKINGNINSEDYTNLGFDLNVIADNFKAVNSKVKDNDLFYGQLFLDNDLDIKGTLDNPIIKGSVKINADTKFTIILPQSDPSIADREGVVEFIDQDQPVLVTIKDPTEQILKTEVKGINASVNIAIDKKAEISIIIDEANGDYLKLQGDAELTGGIDPSGKTTLTGKYEFTGGAYEMNFNLIKRKFDIKAGSYILWTGEPTAAKIDITAVYNVDASPLDLVNNQLSSVTTETRNTYKQKIPFEAELKMEGELLQPEITFDIILPDGNNTVSAEIINTTKAKLQQVRRDEDALNKQVFALLLLNRFIGENPFQSESGGTSGAFLAKQSVSKILSQQLNNIAGDLIKGFELDFDLEATEDYSSGEKEERTDLNVGLSKKLFDDRLKVTIGSSFGLEGAPQENEQATVIAGDVTADYLITKDGRYKLRAYRENNYQVALQGQVIETGVAFIITMDYNKFRELFHKKRKAQKKSKQKNENQ